MIIGVGTDLIDIRRVEKVMQRHEKRFIQRCFTDIERAKAERRREAGTHIATYAKRFAAKEACSKALGTGFSQGVFMKDIGVVNSSSGAPTLHLTGGARKKLNELTPEGYDTRIHLTLTDEPPLAEAMVMIEAYPKGQL
ncbi:MAG: holo-ACP synthase [Micavibrio sp. TMED27]|nr:holo-ACP synthase [Micavibrio sp.]OUT90418.1 MAG: holo-ACP synthase [Micavibrio sp. TMED27]|tara:strand:+ start:126 stop:542 length:417 start_codon:yes stop_codon:yes gene_type:complete